MEILGYVLSKFLDVIVYDLRAILGNWGCLMVSILAAGVLFWFVPAYVLDLQGDDWKTWLVVGPLTTIVVVIMVSGTYGLTREARSKGDNRVYVDMQHRRWALDVIRSRQGPWAILIVQVAILFVAFVSFFGPWGLVETGPVNGWEFALYWMRREPFLVGIGYAALLFYSATIFIGHPYGCLFQVSRVPLVCWLLAGPLFVWNTDMQRLHLGATWGALLFVFVIVLANVLEGVDLIRRGWELSWWPWLVVGSIWVCASLVILYTTL